MNNSRRNRAAPNQRRRGVATKEIVLATFVILSFTMGMYFLSERCFARLYHFIATLVGSPFI